MAAGEVRIAARDVDRVSAERDYMRLHVGRRSWLIHHSMAALEEGLDPELFGSQDAAELMTRAGRERLQAEVDLARITGRLPAVEK